MNKKFFPCADFNKLLYFTHYPDKKGGNDLNRKVFVLLFSLAVILLIASSEISASPENLSSQKFFVSAPANSHPFTNDEHNRSVIDTAGQSRNFTAVFSKSDGTRILEHIKIQRTRTIIFTDEITSKYNFSLSTGKTASEANKARLTEIHQDIQQRK